MQLVSLTRPTGAGLCVAALLMQRWFACGDAPNELVFSLQKVELYLEDLGRSLSIGLCNDPLLDLAPELATLFEPPCKAGKIALGLGAAAAGMTGMAVVCTLFITYVRRLGSLWGAALACNFFGGGLAIASGVWYVIRMLDYTRTDDDSFCQPAQVGPILMLAGGVMSLASSCLFCTCCCRPATHLASGMVAPVSMVQVHHTSPGLAHHGHAYGNGQGHVQLAQQ